MIGLPKPKTWSESPLGEVAEIERASVTAQNIETGTKYVGLEHLDSEGRILAVQTVNNGDLASNKFAFGPKHILYGKLRPYLRKIVRPTFDGVCSTDILPIRATRVDRGFLFHYLRHPRVVEYATGRCEGANLPRISPSELEKFPVHFPPLPEQRRIADILDKADAIRRKRQEINKCLPNLPTSFFEELFGDPVQNPLKLTTVALGEVLSLQGGFAFKSTDYCDTGIPLIRIGNANNLDFRTSSLIYLPADFLERYSRFVLTPGDMIMTLTGTVGKDDYANLVKVPAMFDRWFLNQRVARVRITDPRITEDYLIHFLMHPRIKRLIRNMDRGVRQANLSNEDILTQQIPVPPQDTQKRFSEVVARTGKIQATLTRSMVEDECLFNSLVQRAFRGEL
jgi:type I restriction enzyme S subunit